MQPLPTRAPRLTHLAAIAALGSALAAPVAAQAPGWSKPTPIAASGLNPVQLEATVESDGAGAFYAAWNHPMGAQAAVRPAGGKWAAPTTLTGGTSSALGVTLAARRGGGAVAIWVDIIPGRYGRTAILEATLPAGATAWNGSTQLSVADPTVGAPQVGVAADGSAIAIWLRSDGATLRIESTQRPAGGAWSPPLFISASGASAAAPRLATSPGGIACAAWQERAPGATASDVVAATWSAAGGFATPRRISGPTGAAAIEPQVAVDAAGRAVVAWTRGGAIEACEQRVAQGRFLAPVVVSLASVVAGWPSLAVTDAGDAFLAWSALPPSGALHRVEAATRAPGAAWTASVVLSDTRLWSYEDAGPPRVAASADGSFAVATWEDDLQLGVRAATYGLVGRLGPARGGGWSRPATLGADGLWNDPIPVAAGPNATATAIWMVGITHYKTQLHAARFTR